VSVNVEPVSVDGSIERSNVAVTLLVVATPVELGAGARAVTAGAPTLSSVTLAGVVGRAPMSCRALAVACMMMELGSPTPRVLLPRPRVQWLVPVATTQAPLAAR
jgi:hypothetical protein